MQDGALQKLMFQGSGCIISQAAASLLTEKVIGMPVATIMALSNAEIVALLGMELGPTRQLCVLLSLDALRVALDA